MLSKVDRFQQWRGAKSSSEMQILDLALLISEYVDSADSLEVIKIIVAEKYKEFDQHQGRSWGIIVFAKLYIDEAIEQLPDSADPAKSILVHSSAIISSLYENSKNDPSKNISLLIENIEKLLALDKIGFADKKQYKTFISSSYMLSHLMKRSLDELDWASQMMVALVVNVEQIKLKITRFLQKIEEKARQLEQHTSPAPQSDIEEEDDPLKAIKMRLNNRYLKVLNGRALITEKPKFIRRTPDSRIHSQRVSDLHHAENKPARRSVLASLKELEMDIAKVSSGISNLLDLRNKKNEIELQIQKINELLLAAEANDRKITGRKYFLNFIESYPELFQTLLNNCEESRKKTLIEKINQLKSLAQSQDLSSEVMNGVGWVASPLTLVYRTATPQVLQDIITARLPATLDSACKDELKELAKTCLIDLNNKLKKKEHQINAINNRLFSKDEELKRLITHERAEQLICLQKANDALQDTVHATQKLLVTVKENLHFLNNLKEKSDTLNEFIRLHDGILVKIFNFLAQFFSFFKTDTAKMIDKASVLKSKVDRLALEYQSAVAKDMRQIENNPNLDQNIKTDLRRQFNAEEKAILQEKQTRVTPSKHNVRLLMHSLSQLFATNPHPVKEHLGNEKENMDRDDAFCCT